MKITKEQLIKEKAVLENSVKEMLEKDYQTRKTLSELLDSYNFTNEYGYSKTRRDIYVRDWLGIAFLIGELKADADYAMCIQSRDDLRMENENLKQKIRELETPTLLSKDK